MATAGPLAVPSEAQEIYRAEGSAAAKVDYHAKNDNVNTDDVPIFLRHAFFLCIYTIYKVDLLFVEFLKKKY